MTIFNAEFFLPIAGLVIGPPEPNLSTFDIIFRDAILGGGLMLIMFGLLCLCVGSAVAGMWKTSSALLFSVCAIVTVRRLFGYYLLMQFCGTPEYRSVVGYAVACSPEQTSPLSLASITLYLAVLSTIAVFMWRRPSRRYRPSEQRSVSTTPVMA